MKKTYCDICGKEIIGHNPVDFGSTDLFYDLDERMIADVCRECFGTVFACINMMKKSAWKPDFHEVLESEDIGTRMHAEYAVCEIEDKTSLKF